LYSHWQFGLAIVQPLAAIVQPLAVWFGKGAINVQSVHYLYHHLCGNLHRRIHPFQSG